MQFLIILLSYNLDSLHKENIFDSFNSNLNYLNDDLNYFYNIKQKVINFLVFDLIRLKHEKLLCVGIQYVGILVHGTI